MSGAVRFITLVLALAFAARCASSPGAEPEAARAAAPAVSPADLVGSLAEVAAGRNPAMREAGLMLQTIELKLMVGQEERSGGKLQIVILNAEASRRSELSFVQTFVMEVPGAPKKGVAARPLVPGVEKFVEAAMETARDLARAGEAAGLPQKLAAVELIAKLEGSRKLAGGIAFTAPIAFSPAIGVGAGSTALETNTIKLVFGPAK